MRLGAREQLEAARTNRNKSRAAGRFLMACTSMHSLHDFCPWMNRRRAVAFAVILALLITGCGRQTSGTIPLFPAPQGNTWGFIDNRGKAVIAPRFEAALPYSEGLAAVKREGRWGYIDRNGLEVIPIRYRTVQSFRNGVAIVDTGLPNQPVGLIDTAGSWVTPPLFRSLSAADGPDGLLLGQKEPAEGSGFYDRSGKLVLGPYFLAFPFVQGRARVKTGVRASSDDWLIDASGTPLPKKPVVLDGIRLSEGLSLVSADRDQPGRKYGYVDPSGKWAIKPVWDDAQPFHEGLAYVGTWKDGKAAYIDHKGRTIWEGRNPSP